MKRELKVDNPQILLDKISEYFPNITWQKYVFLDHSWEFQVIILDNSIVFRFPTTKSLIPTLKREIQLLKIIKTDPRYDFPVYKYIAPEWQFGGYNIVSGNELDHKLFKQLIDRDRAQLSSNIGVFLKNLHNTSIPPGTTLRSTTRELLDEDSQLLQKCNQHLKSILSERVFSDIKHVLTAAMELRSKTTDKKLIHGDFYGRHILWDSKLKLTGFIDFSDANLGDPAIDFAELFEFGVIFTRRVLTAYDSTDSELLSRALVYYQRVGVYLMINSFEDTKISFDEAHKLFLKASNISLS